MKKNVWLLGLVTAGLLLAACNDDDDDGGRAATAAEIQGKWYLRQMDADGSAIIKSALLDTTLKLDTTATYAGTEYYAHFKSDSTYEFRQPDFDPTGLSKLLPGGGSDSATMETGKWRLSGTTLTTISSEGDSLDVKATLSAGALVMQYAIDTAFTDTTEFGPVTLDLDTDLKATFRK